MMRAVSLLAVLLVSSLPREGSAFVSVGRTARFQDHPMVASPTATARPRQLRPRTAREMTMGLDSLWAAYTELLIAKPLLTKCVTASVIIGAGDAAAQAVERIRVQQAADRPGVAVAEEKKRLDWIRVLRWAFFGLVLQAPWNHYFFLALDTALPPPAEPFSLINLLKVTVDQFGQSPIFTGLCFIFLSALEGKTMSEISQKLQTEYKGTVINSWKLWIPAAFVNIGFVPPPLRVLFINTVFFFWTVYLSLVVNKPVPETAGGQ